MAERKKNMGKVFEKEFKDSVPADCFLERYKDDTSGFYGVSNPADFRLYKFPVLPPSGKDQISSVKWDDKGCKLSGSIWRVYGKLPGSGGDVFSFCGICGEFCKIRGEKEYPGRVL